VKLTGKWPKFVSLGLLNQPKTKAAKEGDECVAHRGDGKFNHECGDTLLDMDKSLVCCISALVPPRC